MRSVAGIFVTCVFLGAASVSAQESPNRSPSVEFARRSLDTLMSVSAPSANRWREVAASHPNEMVAAIVAAQKRGWKPTARTFYHSRGQRPLGPGLRPITFLQNFGTSTSDGEILVWDWDDGNPTTAEGTIWTHSYSTGNEVMFNVQLAGDTYDNLAIPYQEEVYSSFVDPPPAPQPIGLRGPALPGPSSVTPVIKARFLLVGQRSDCDDCYRRQESYHQNYCNRRWLDAGSACMVRAAGERLRDGLRGSAASAGVGAAIGAYSGGLAGALTGAGVSAGPGFLAGVVGSLIWGTDYDCRGDAQRDYNTCMAEPADYSYCHSLYGCLSRSIQK